MRIIAGIHSPTLVSLLYLIPHYVLATQSQKFAAIKTLGSGLKPPHLVLLWNPYGTLVK